jgi:hypothetical protein
MKVIQPTRRVLLKVATDGKAPKAYGNGVYKIGQIGGQAHLLRSRGWTVEKECRAYNYMRPPASEQGKPSFFIEVAIPTREQIIEMAEEAHRQGADWAGRVGEWLAYYMTAKGVQQAEYDPRTGRPISEPETVMHTDPTFQIGVRLLWDATVWWKEGTVHYGENIENIAKEAVGWLPFGAEVEAGEVRPTPTHLPEKVLRAITERKGQAAFRDELFVAYGGRCAITQCDAEPALEAAHILGYAETGSQAISNGLLLRADIHTLFDTGHIRIDPETMTVVLSKTLAATCYQELAGMPLRLPDNTHDRPNRQALRERWLSEVARTCEGGSCPVKG